MATIKEYFVQAIDAGMTAAKAIPDSSQRATAYASLAQAMALSGLIAGGAVNIASTTEAVKEAPTKSETPAPKKELPKATGKGALGAVPKGETKKETPEPAPTPAPAEEQQPELVAEWTDEMMELQGPYVEKMQSYIEQYTREIVTECVGQFSEGSFEANLDNITPLNIEAFVIFLDEMAANANA